MEKFYEYEALKMAFGKFSIPANNKLSVIKLAIHSLARGLFHMQQTWILKLQHTGE